MTKRDNIEAKRGLSDGTSNDRLKWAKQAVSQTAEPKPIMCAYPQCLDTQILITPSFEAMNVIKAALTVKLT